MRGVRSPPTEQFIVTSHPICLVRATAKCEEQEASHKTMRANLNDTPPEQRPLLPTPVQNFPKANVEPTPQKKLGET